jgi:multiple sugar transport system substrate-binding protein
VSEKGSTKSGLRPGLHLNLRTNTSALAAATLGVAMLATFTTGASPAQASPARAILTAAARDLTAAASCPGGAVTVTTEDYYGVPSKTNASGTGVQDFFNNYTATHPCVKVVRQDPVVTGDSAYLTHILSQFSSGSEPDLLMVDNPELAEFAADGVLVPLSSLGSLSVVSKINPANVAETTYNGKLYALPLATNTIAIFYNKTLVQQAGITTLPTTWAEFSADAKKAAHGSDLGFVFSGQAGPGQATWQFDPWSWSNGGSMLDPDGMASVQALAFLTSLVKEGAAPKDVVNWSQAQPIQEFEAGKAAFCENGLWNIPTLDTAFSKLKWGAFEIPTRAPGQTVIAPFGGEVWSIPKTNPTEEKAAFALLDAMSSNLVGFAKDLAAVPTEPSLWSTPPWNTSVYAPFLAELKHGRARTAGIKNPANEPAIDLDIGNEIEAALIGKVTPAAAMQAAQTQIAPLLK